MRGINSLAGIGTVFIFIGIFCFRALTYKKKFKEETETDVPIRRSGKVLLILGGLLSIFIGATLILKAGRLI